MILENMSYEDIARTMKSDFEHELIRGYNSCFGRREEFGKKAMKLRAVEDHFFGELTKITRNENKYIYLFFSRGRNDYKMNGILRHVRLEYMRKDGTHAAVFDFSNLNNVTFYTPHFFERVRTRLYKDEEKPLSLVRTCFCYQHIGSRVHRLESTKYKNSIFGVTPVGICLGEMMSDELWEFRTFISFEMLKDDQKILTEEGINVLEQMEELRTSVPGLLTPNFDESWIQ